MLERWIGGDSQEVGRRGLEAKSVFPTRRAACWKCVWRASRVTKHAASSGEWGGGEGSSNPLAWLLAVTQVLSASKGMQSYPLSSCQARCSIPGRIHRYGRGRRWKSPIPSQAPVVTLSWVLGEAPLFSVAPSPTLVWSVGAGEALAVVWLQGRVTTRQSDCKIKLRGAGFLCVLLLKRLLRGLESYVQNGRLCKELMVMVEGWGSRLLGSLEWTCTRCCI